MNEDLGTFIVYLCPTGELNTQLESYFAKSRQLYGENTAHKYMPHCTLTGFFKDKVSSVSMYIKALDRAYFNIQDNYPNWNIELKSLTFNDNWHGLELKSQQLKEFIVNFIQLENSSTRTEDLRPKDWLHLSLAYDFDPQYKDRLQELATETIDIQADVDWELRFYQKYPNWSWRCWKAWQLLSMDN